MTYKSSAHTTESNPPLIVCATPYGIKLSKDDRVSADKRTPQQNQWRTEAAAALDASGHHAEALAFKFCGDESAGYTFACSADPLHFSRSIPKTCKCRYCSDCESRAQGLRLQKYLPAIDAALKSGPSSYRLRHIVLTTPIPLTAEEARTKYVCYWRYVNQALNRVAWRELNKQNLLSAAEVKRGRVDYKKHDIGLLIGAEFGEVGHKLHFHVLWWGCWIASEWLTEEYRKVTHDESKVTKIKLVREAAEGAQEVLAKYATKLTELPPVLVPVLRDVLKGTRRVRSYGVFFAAVQDEKESYCCPECRAALTIWPTLLFQDYRESLTAWRAEKALLNSIQAHKSGENRGPPTPGLQLSLPDMPTERPNRMKYFDAME